MNARIALILVVLLAVLGGGALLYQHQEGSRRPENVGTLGRNLFKDLKAAEVAAIRIVEPKSTLTVRQKNERWVLVERGDFCLGASSASSHMAHGGIRYLENGEFRLVREAVQDYRPGLAA